MAPPEHDDECHYKVLGVGKRASLNEIRKGFKKLALKFHPDKQHTEQDKMDATAVFVKINNAHEVLSDPVQRAQYDEKLEASSYKRTTKNSAGSGESSGNRQQQNQHEWGSYQGDRSGNSSQQKSYSSSKPRSNAWGSTSWGSTNGYGTYHQAHSNHGYGTYHQDSYRYSSENPQSSNTGGNKSSFHGRRHSYQHASQNNQWSTNRGSHSSHQEGNNAYSSSKPRPQSSAPAPNGRSSSGNRQKTSSKPSARCNEQGSQSKKSKSTSHSRSAIFGTCKTTGDPCKRCIHLGRYCYQHKTQDPSCSSYQPPPQPEYPREDVFGRNANGIPCKRCMKQGGFCYQHTYQQEEYNNSGGAKQYSQKRSPNTSSGSSRRVYGVRADGKPCTRCMKQGRFCFQHVHQET